MTEQAERERIRKLKWHFKRRDTAARRLRYRPMNDAPLRTLAIGEAPHASRPIRFWPHALQFTNFVAVVTVMGGVRRISHPTVVVRRMPTVVTDIDCWNAGIGQTVPWGRRLDTAKTNH
jgi:hypothetical protein